MAEHRVFHAASRGSRLPDRSSDPRGHAVEDQLSQLRPAADPDPQFRSDLRAQLVAIAPRLVAEGTPAQVGATGKHRASAAGTASTGRSGVRRRRFPIARTLRVLAAAVVVCGLLLGGAFWLGRDALPGDNLYGLKRAGERVEFSLAGSDSARGQDRLEFAQTRATEVLALWKNARSSAVGTGPLADAGVNEQTAALIDDTLHDANADLTAGASTLNTVAVRTHSASPLRTMIDWSGKQQAVLSSIEGAMKDANSSLLPDVVSSATLLRQAIQRATVLGHSLDCTCARGTGTDNLGPKPCTPCTTSPPAPTGQPSAGSSSAPGTGTGTGTGTGSSPATGSSPGTGPGATRGPGHSS